MEFASFGREAVEGGGRGAKGKEAHATRSAAAVLWEEGGGVRAATHRPGVGDAVGDGLEVLAEGDDLVGGVDHRGYPIRPHPALCFAKGEADERGREDVLSRRGEATRRRDVGWGEQTQGHGGRGCWSRVDERKSNGHGVGEERTWGIQCGIDGLPEAPSAEGVGS